MTEPREIEAKFEIDDPTPLLRLQQAPPLAVVGNRQIEQADTYLDTTNASLHNGGSTLRLRESDGRWTLTFKGERAPAVAGRRHVASRVEINERVDAGVAATILAGRRPAGRLAPLVMADEFSGGERLAPVARIHNDRTVIDLVDEAGLQYELAVDRCRGERLADGRAIEFSEVELEARTPDHDALLRAADALRAAVPGLRPSGQTKLARVLG
ncbi:MAG TPA: CYTH domain-containing protein [Thermomicrobiales bacterium]|nr:CYTH domain-containing protein [Thermomicrobiales bacterium]